MNNVPHKSGLVEAAAKFILSRQVKASVCTIFYNPTLINQSVPLIAPSMIYTGAQSKSIAECVIEASFVRDVISHVEGETKAGYNILEEDKQVILPPSGWM